jgi:hypothetical protein
MEAFHEHDAQQQEVTHTSCNRTEICESMYLTPVTPAHVSGADGHQSPPASCCGCCILHGAAASSMQNQLDLARTLHIKHRPMLHTAMSQNWPNHAMLA